MRKLTWLAGAAAAALITTAVPAVAEEPPDPNALTTIQSELVNNPQGTMQPQWRADTKTGVTPQTIGIPGGYDPDTLRAHLKLSGTGKGQTVVITVAFDVAAAVTKSVTNYSSWYGLKPPCSDTVTTGCFPLKFEAPNGTAPGDVNNIFTVLGFQIEADMDVQLVHALAPDAAITVVQGYDNSIDSMMAAVDHATSLNPAVISHSWGASEFEGEQAYDSHCSATGVACVFASGDAGNPGLYPAANPAVLAVGGTTLDMGPDGKVRSEAAWPGSGGGISPFEPRPAYQSAANPYDTGRGLPDVSFNGDPRSGFAVYAVAEVPGFSFLRIDRWEVIGGTSAGAPIWSAILAVADQQRAARGKQPLTADQVHGAAYGKTKQMFDVTVGANGICGPICTAGRGYDLVTGMGSPRTGIDTYLARY